jgi:hypothetical protein
MFAPFQTGPATVTIHGVEIILVSASGTEKNGVHDYKFYTNETPECSEKSVRITIPFFSKPG